MSYQSMKQPRSSFFRSLKQQLESSGTLSHPGDKALLHAIADGTEIATQSETQLAQALIAKLRNDQTHNPKRNNRSFAGRFHFYPSLDNSRIAEGGKRTRGIDPTREHDGPLVTIVTVVFNNADTLARCIESVKLQTYTNIEYIIIDGGSSDGTIDVIKQNESYIDYYISEKDAGIYAAMNKGIELSSGKYICLLNSDDEYKPNFVERSIAVAADKHDKIIFSNYLAGEVECRAIEPNPGIFLNHLNINHNTFLVPRDVYDRIGPYDEEYRIVSDAIWMRSAFRRKELFVHLPEVHFTLHDGGLSSGQTEKHRQMFISEAGRSIRAEFPFLSKEESEQLYLFRFNKSRVSEVLAVVHRHAEQSEFAQSVACMVEFCFRHRRNFALHHSESSSLFPKFVELCEQLNICKSAIKINTKRGCFSEILTELKRTISIQKGCRKKRVLHFLSVFSAAPETFIYDLVRRMEEDNDFDNFVLYEHELLVDQRPFQKRLYVPWSDFHAPIRDEIYRFIFETLNPDLVVAHFAINEHKLSQRLERLELSFPTIAMTHGIDVFKLKEGGEYQAHVIEKFARRPDAVFTAVSDFLRRELIQQGVPPEKVFKVSNAVSGKFFLHRKTDNFYRQQRVLKMLLVGRLIDWKGHHHFIEALQLFRTMSGQDFHATIVYGNGDGEKAKIEKLLRDYSLTTHVELIPFVNFSENPDYHSQFDLFVHPSTYSTDGLGKSETFGVALLEAISAGLPVITTDAGGLPEVAGEDQRYARIVPHGDSQSMAEALIETLNDTVFYSDNTDYAIERLGAFNSENQIAALKNAVSKLQSRAINVAMFSTSTIQGAGYAAYRLHQGLNSLEGVTNILHTTVRNHENDPSVQVLPHPSGNNKNWQSLQSADYQKPNLTIFSVNHPHIPNARLGELVGNADVISIHWTARFLSIENIAFLSRLGKPVVITIRDMHPITGGCHYFHRCQKWMSDCTSCPQLLDDWDNFPAKVLSAKREHYNFSNITIVTLSQHSAEIVSRAPFFRECRLEVIHNSIETETFTPIDPVLARQQLDLPANRKIIAYLPSFSSEVKGYKEFVEAMNHLQEVFPQLDPLIVLIGNETPATETIRMDKRVLGYINENAHLAKAYAAADVVAVPSLEETFSNTTAEALACGTPVVGFKTGAIHEMVSDGVTGFTYEPGDSLGLATGIARVLSDLDLSDNCRRYADSNLRFEIQAEKYRDLFQDLAFNDQIGYQQRRVYAPDAFPETTPTILRLIASKTA